MTIQDDLAKTIERKLTSVINAKARKEDRENERHAKRLDAIGTEYRDACEAIYEDTPELLACRIQWPKCVRQRSMVKAAPTEAKPDAD